MNTLHSELIKICNSYPDVLFGFSHTSFSDYKDQYKSYIVLAVPHSISLTLNSYSEKHFEKLINETRKTIDNINNNLKTLFDSFKVQYEFPPIAQSSEETLLAPFSFKYAAVNASLGWIGKNDILIINKYGPRVRLSAVLVNCDLPISTPILESQCPKDCFKCINACPCHALTGNMWNINSLRHDLIDYFLCNKMRSAYIKTHNRKNSCGLCFVACPIGL
ncbi:Fe-S protein [endosymbiont 'TC1' of Trimyema compressum]|uniref:epoxyqueuosine reductase n=1 Tax=endosymbiont 'TC1' of Trimyema compressum TaxID=243899 RepID=UPI0007F08C40|nr:epoxyqueuosine reductase [endosymbiont 'TC1' of Trimyema compressum]AMP20968.1 Fe-S protein [endosymbiont 'TC1' of Trimyema compressum]